MADEVLRRLYGYGLTHPRASYLSAAVNATDLVWSVTDASQFSPGVAEAGDELVWVESVDTGTNTLTVAPDGRGWGGTAAVGHGGGARVEANPAWTRLDVKLAINDAIAGTHPTLFGVDAVSFNYNVSRNTYEVPATTERVLSVVAETIGPSKEPQVLRRYRFNPTDPESSTGKSVTLGEQPAPGRTVRVSLMVSPSAIGDSDDFTVSGLRATARPAVVYMACSSLLSFADAARLQADTAQSWQASEGNQIGSAARLSTQLYQRYLLELESERKRLRQAHPVSVTVRSR
ncbi:hypothetical protein [Nocardioides massiliensis]|uniref:Minor tail protein n=1 Tax=Nocardioides massiliensis TaxID=1325935 RepID=A0ABT9NJ92_9ACTN|nr:hypothetical protein [Nocardioides massiliensis]MDP9820492.1 hypothetical protein [Nocardioides massiliensis]